MKKILIVIGRYVPGYKDGGPVRTIKNLVDALGTEYEFCILTLDRDRGDTEAYDSVKISAWNIVGNTRVYYAPREQFGLKLVKKLAEGMDIVYVCGCFDFYARIVMNLKRKGQIRAKVIIASMGLFSPGAYQIKRWKKDAYIWTMRITGNFRDIAWSATSQEEVSDIKRIIGGNAVCHIARDLPRPIRMRRMEKQKERGSIRIIFLSRISLKKNLLYAINIVGKLEGSITFDIYGPVEDKYYWEECQRQIKLLPENVICTYGGMIESEKVIDRFEEYHAFLFPTMGENFGHVIFEAMAGGCVPVISDQTPWMNLDQKGTGYVRELSDQKGFRDALQELIGLNASQFRQKLQNIERYVNDISSSGHGKDGYRKMFG